MADALVERRPPARFFCHRCNIEFEDVLQDYTCPYCASGFIEQLEAEAEAPASGDDFSDADMSNLDDMSTIDEMSNFDDSDDMHQSTPPMLNDLAFLMSGGRLRGTGRRETLMEQLVWMIGGARAGTGPVAAGAPFVLVGAPGDYVFGGEGLDAVVTQLLGQLEHAGPPPLPREQIAAIPSEPVSAEQAAANTSCSVCWDSFQVGETISRLECGHIFHSSCIQPWLQLHATCPICRRSLLAEEPSPPAPPPADDAPPPDAQAPPSDESAPHSESSTTSLPRLVLIGGAATGMGSRAGGVGRGALRRRRWSAAAGNPAAGVATAAGASSSSSTSSPAAAPRSSASSTSSTSSLESVPSAQSTRSNTDELHAQYNMDIDFD